MAKTKHLNSKCQFKTNNKVWELVFNDSWFYFWTNPYFETITGFQLGTYLIISKSLQHLEIKILI